MTGSDGTRNLAGVVVLLAAGTASLLLLVATHGGRPGLTRPADPPPVHRPRADRSAARPAGGAFRVSTAVAPTPEQAMAVFAAACRERFRDPARAESARSAVRSALAALPPTHPGALLLARSEAFLQARLRNRPAFSGVDWGELEARAAELATYPGTDPWGKELLDWTSAEREAQSLVDSAQRAPRGLTIEEFYSALRQVPPDSVFREEASAKQRVIREVLVERTFRGASERVRLGDYRGGLGEIHALFALLDGDDGEAQAALAPLRSECQSRIHAQDRLREAEDFLRDGRLDEAERALAGLPEDLPAPLAARAQIAREELPLRRRLAEAEARYDRGDGPAALSLLEGDSHPEAAALRTRIEAVVDLDRGARAAAARGHANESILLWVDLLEREADPDNAYRRAAAAQPVVEKNCLVPADRACSAGLLSLEAARWAEARERLDEALRLFPHHPRAEDAVRQFLREAEREFNSDTARHHKGEISLDLILVRFEGVLAFLRPEDGDLYESYQSAYRRLRARRPEPPGK